MSQPAVASGGVGRSAGSIGGRRARWSGDVAVPSIRRGQTKLLRALSALRSLVLLVGLWLRDLWERLFRAFVVAIQPLVVDVPRALLFLLAVVVAAGVMVGGVVLTRQATAPAAIEKPAVAALKSGTAVDPFAVSDGRNGRSFALVAGVPLFPLPGVGELGYDENSPVEAQGVAVNAVAQGGFWIGDSGMQRVFVEISKAATDTGSLALTAIQPGQQLNISGRMTEAPVNLTGLGLDSTGSGQLSRQAQFVQADSVRPAS